MRSRYSAYAEHAIDYLGDTLHPDHRSDWDRDATRRWSDSAEWVAKEPPPVVVVRNFGDSSIDLQLRVWIDDARKRMRTIFHITDRVKTAFDEQGIEIPYPKRDIYIKGKV